MFLSNRGGHDVWYIWQANSAFNFQDCRLDPHRPCLAVIRTFSLYAEKVFSQMHAESFYNWALIFS